jgi:hypothetical protein
MKGMPDPYKKAKQKCILCKYDVDVDYKVSIIFPGFLRK